MNTLATTQQYEEIRKLIVSLSVEEQLRLLSELSSSLQKKITAQSSTSQAAPTGTVRGKYAHVPTSSDRFAELKRQEIELER
ncbi:MAG: hypothetical protein ONB44_16530 [candidate division KSB1 bacterium]|nr:hypothetical protein [candidate division KSB1 bacterium]MDZ7303741.1 hypothetical protein [candidate division KSB1 bacterium]MDZ7313122.1 hypothetical protein [candidate division KSB1 bacterium]